MIESAKEIELPAGIALGVMETHKLSYHYKVTVCERTTIKYRMTNQTPWKLRPV